MCISTGLPEGHKLNQTEDCQMSDFDNRDEEEKKETGLEEEIRARSLRIKGRKDG